MRKFVFGALAALSALAVFAASEKLTWNASPSGELVTLYRVYWSTNSNAPKPWTNLVTVPATELSATGAVMVAGVHNYYYVTAANDVGESDPSDVGFRPFNGTNLKIGNGQGVDLLSWKTAPAADLVTGYKLYWSTNITAAKPWLVYASVPGLNATGSVTTVKNYYYLASTNVFGESDPSDVAFKPGGPSNLKLVPAP